MNKKTVAVIFGGVSNEYFVSLRSAASVLENISKQRYNICMLGITQAGVWYEYTGDVANIVADTWLQSGNVTPAFIVPDRSIGGYIRLENQQAQRVSIDIAFPVMHGKNAEDGTMQGLLELSGIAYVGCNVSASTLCMDKEYTHRVLDQAGIQTAKWLKLSKQDWQHSNDTESFVSSTLSYPVFVKPANAGSSVGVSKAMNYTQLCTSLELAFIHDKKVIIEGALLGKEVECAVLGNENPKASSIGEIAPTHDIYDYEAKYINDTANLYIPARIPVDAAQKIKEIAILAYKTLGCSGLSRVDFFLCDTGEIILNEINTMPGFTSISMYPKLFIHDGITYPDLIDALLTFALQKNKE
ncbi:MAG: D-alanine--D-alanine ligase family protein [Oscillospiraceae bacterium]